MVCVFLGSKHISDAFYRSGAVASCSAMSGLVIIGVTCCVTYITLLLEIIVPLAPAANSQADAIADWNQIPGQIHAAVHPSSILSELCCRTARLNQVTFRL